MKSDAERSDGQTASSNGESPPSGAEAQSDDGKERDLDELRRFRVRTVPPDMRRQWMLAETPVVSTLELQDTLPPNKRPSNAPPDSGARAPQRLFGTPRVSSTAATRRLPRVVPRNDRAMTIAATAVGLTFAVVLIGLVWRGSVARHAKVTHNEPISAVDERTPPVDEPWALDVRREEPLSAPSAQSTAAPAPKPPVRAPKPATSGKVAPAQKPRVESDIKNPLFGK
jgi:hypothetical protein